MKKKTVDKLSFLQKNPRHLPTADFKNPFECEFEKFSYSLVLGAKKKLLIETIFCISTMHVSVEK